MRSVRQRSGPRVPRGGAARAAILRGCVAGGVTLLAVMGAVAAVVLLTRGVARDATGAPDLGEWLRVQLAAGALASFLAGSVSRRVARDPGAAPVLGAVVLVAGLVEAVELTRAVQAGLVLAPLGLVWAAPWVAACGVLLGGWRRGARPTAAAVGAPVGLMPAAPGARRWLGVLAPLGVILSATAVALLSLPEVAAAAEARVLAAAVAVDLMVTAPALAWFGLVRTRRAPWVVLVPIAVVGYVLASLAIPARHQLVLEPVRWLLPLAELGLLAWLLARVRRTWTAAGDSDDFVDRLRSSARAVSGHRVVADILATEVGVLWHALRVGRPRPRGEQAFAVKRDPTEASVLVGLTLLLAVETFPVHVAVSAWSPALAWVLTALSGYAFLWLLGDHRALSARVVRLAGERLELRFGLRSEADIPLAAIAGVEGLGAKEETPKGVPSLAARGVRPNVRLVLREPVTLVGMYGLRRAAREVRLGLEEPDRFVERLARSPGARAR